jgi:hypothetical protein
MQNSRCLYIKLHGIACSSQYGHSFRCYMSPEDLSHSSTSATLIALSLQTDVEGGF